MTRLEILKREWEARRKELEEYRRSNAWTFGGIKVREDMCIEVYEQIKSIERMRDDDGE